MGVLRLSQAGITNYKKYNDALAGNASVTPIANWTRVAPSTNLLFLSALYAPLTNASYFLWGSNDTASTSNYLYSTDGSSWTTGTMPASKVWGTSATNGTRIVVFEKNASDTVIATTTNGTTWTTASIATITAEKVIWDGTYFIVTNSASTSAVIYYSADGITGWTAVDAGANGNGIGYDGSSRHILTRSGRESEAFTTTTGVTSAGNWSGITLPSSSTWFDVIYGNGYWVVRGFDVAAYSTNGTTWTAFTSGGESGTSTTYQFFNNYIFAKGNFYTFNIGTNGVTFQVIYRPTPVDASTTLDFNIATGSGLDSAVTAAFGDGRMVVAGRNTASTNGLDIFIGV